eukprot:TRINITY_DN1196_c0_g4_i1.p1 TRINITY_DN1196_c0_g4~~TRINITY_DN1196_c0_g4_i1.p1  ORF type:complete len:721 (+),score=151.87 TRINITY_DN1196_c0_g4_i1:36-2165(+)
MAREPQYRPLDQSDVGGLAEVQSASSDDDLDGAATPSTRQFWRRWRLGAWRRFARNGAVALGVLALAGFVFAPRDSLRGRPPRADDAASGDESDDGAALEDLELNGDQATLPDAMDIRLPWDPRPKPETFPSWRAVLLTTAAVDKGARCLDGSPAGFYIQDGWGSGAARWMIHLQGGGWCLSLDDCVKRSKGDLGSTSTFPEKKDELLRYYDGGAHGLLSDRREQNPDFYNWNKVYVHYCDGASYSGDVADPVRVGNETIYFRGRRVLDAVLDALLEEHGMRRGSQLIFKGCSAGGLGVWMHCDYVAGRMPKSLVTTCVPECGLFMDMLDLNGAERMTPSYRKAATMQNVFSPGGNLNVGCLKAYSKEPWRCFMAQYTLPYVKTRTFAVNSVHDSFQAEWLLGVSKRCFEAGMVQSSLRPLKDTKHGLLGRLGFASCNEREEVAMQALRRSMIDNVSHGLVRDGCTDIAGWANGVDCRSQGFRASQHCSAGGWTCDAYELWGWCKDGKVAPGQTLNAGDAKRNPEQHCCVCGGGSKDRAASGDELATFEGAGLGAELWRYSCADTDARWGNGQPCESEGLGPEADCLSSGLTCEAYARRKWCSDGKPTSAGTAYLGDLWNNPEKHCCVCGGGVARSVAADAHKDGFFLYDCASHCGYMNSPKWNTLSNGYLTLRQAFSAWYFSDVPILSKRAAGRNWGRRAGASCFGGA